MFATLPESAARRPKRAGGLLVSATVHAALIGLAIYATAFSEPAPAASHHPPEHIVFIPPAPPRRVAPPVLTPPSGLTTGAATPVAPIVAPLEVPDVIIPQTGPEIPLDPTLFTHGSGATSTIAGEAPRAGAPAGGEPWAAPTVDRQVVPRAGNPTPRYPAPLQAAGVEGTVHMRFIVDTLGRVERASIVALSAGHPLFEAAVRESLLRTRYEPAEAGGRRVRQLVEQVFQFETVRRRD